MVDANPHMTEPQDGMSMPARVLSALVAGGVGGSIGAFIGWLGNKRTETRTFSQYALALGGAVAGMVVSTYATRNDPERRKALDDSEFMRVTYPQDYAPAMAPTKPAAAVAGVNHQGVVAEATPDIAVGR